MADEARDAMVVELKDYIKRRDEAAIKAGETAVRMVILTNGGAVVAVLAFLGNLGGKAIPAAQIPAVGGTLIWFAWGIVAGLVSLMFAYLVHHAQINFGRAIESGLGPEPATIKDETAYNKAWQWRALSNVVVYASGGACVLSLLLLV